MLLTETLDLLKIIESFIPNFKADNQVRVEDWNAVLGDITFDEAKEHLYSHFRESEFQPKPVDILRRVRDKEQKLIEDLTPVNISEFAKRCGAEPNIEDRIDIMTELYFELFSKQLKEKPIEREYVKDVLMQYLNDAPDPSAERIFRASSVIFALKHTKRFLSPKELTVLALDRTKQLIGRVAFD